MDGEQGLFDPPEEEGQQIQMCDICLNVEIATTDGLRVRGWASFDGLSFTGKPVTATVCPACRKGK